MKHTKQTNRTFQPAQLESIHFGSIAKFPWDVVVVRAAGRLLRSSGGGVDGLTIGSGGQTRILVERRGG